LGAITIVAESTGEGGGVSGRVEHGDLADGQVFFYRSSRLALVELVVDASGVATFAFFDNRLPFFKLLFVESRFPFFDDHFPFFDNGSRRGGRFTLLIELVVDTAREEACSWFNGRNDGRLPYFNSNSPSDRLHRSANCRASNRLSDVHSDRGT
jgi:hypothetical protein